MTAYDTIKTAVLGNPPNPNKQPDPVGVVRAFAEQQAQVEAAQAGALVFGTVAAMNASGAVPSANIMAWAMSGPNAGIYQNTGSALTPTWTRRGSIPQFLVTGINTGVGTVNSIVVTTDLPFPAEDGRAMLIIPTLGPNNVDGPTVSINGAAHIPIITNSGSPVAANGLTTNGYVVGFVSAGKFRLLSDQASAAIQAAAEAAAAQAIAARDQAIAAASSVVAELPSRLYAVNNYHPTIGPDFIRVAGFFAAGDGGGYLAKKVASQPTHTGRIPVTLSGGSTQWYEMVDTAPSPKCFGAIGDWNGTTGYDDTVSINNWINYAIAKTGTLALDNAYYRITSKIVVSMPNALSPLSIIGRGRDVGAFVFDCDDGGFDFTLNNGARLGKNTLTIRDCTFITTRLASAAGTAIKANGQNLEGMTHPGVIVEACFFRGQTSSLGWAGGINLVNSTKNQIRYNDFIGQQGGAAEYTAKFISVTGANYPTDHLIQGNYCVFVNIGVEIAQTVEGAFILNNVLVACRTGIVRSSDIGGRPLFYVIGNHISAWGTCIFCPDGVAQAFINDNVLYDFSLGTSVWTGIFLRSAVEYWIENNVIASFSSGRTCYGIDVNTSGGGWIRDNLLRGTSSAPQTIGIAIGGSVNTTKVLDNLFKDCASTVAGTGDYGVTVKNTYGNFTGPVAISANGYVNITVPHTLGVTPTRSKTQFTLSALSGTYDALPAQVVSVSSTNVVLKAKIENYSAPGNLQANVYLEV